jgi:hypothetical protein
MSTDYGPSGAALGFPYTPAQGGGGGAVALAGDVTGTSAASVVSELQGEVLTITGPLAAGEVLASDAGGTALINVDIATVLGVDPAGNLTALGIPDPTGAPDGQVVTTASGALVLATPSGIDTSLQAAPDTGWTAAGDGTASITSGVATITVTSAQTSGVLRRAQVVCSPQLPAIELIARVTVTTAPVSGDYYVGIGVINTDIPASAATVRGLLVQADSAGTIAGLYTNSSGSWYSQGSASLPAAIGSGNLWLRLVYSAGGVAAFVGSGATIPSTWTLLAAVAPVHAISGPGTVSQITVYAGRSGGSGDLVCDIEDIQWRSLLGAPA